MGYRGKVHEQCRARELRAQAWTLDEIALELGVSKSSVSLWVRDVEFVPRPRQRRLRRGINALQRRKVDEIERLHQEGLDRIGVLSEREFLVAGAALYAGEGTKRDGHVGFANADPRMIRLFCVWLRHFFDVDESRLRVALYLHEGLDLEESMAYWSSVTGIAVDQFTKPYRAVPDPTIRTAKHIHGCPRVGYSCSHTHRSVMGLVGALLTCDGLPG